MAPRRPAVWLASSRVILGHRLREVGQLVREVLKSGTPGAEVSHFDIGKHTQCLDLKSNSLLAAGY